MARSHTTFTPSSLLLGCSLLHLLASLIFTSFQLASLTPLPLCALITLHLRRFHAALIAVSPLFLLSLLLLSHVFVLGQCLFMEEGTPTPYAVLQKVE